MDSPESTDSRMIRDALRDLPNPVALLWYTTTTGSWYSRAERRLLEESARLRPRSNSGRSLTAGTARARNRSESDARPTSCSGVTRTTRSVIMVNLFPYLAVRYQAGDVPTTVVNGSTNVVGRLAEDEYLSRILRLVG